MAQEPPKPRGRPAPIVGPPILDQQPEREAVRMPRAEPAKRTITLPGIPTVPVPRNSGEYEPTLRAPPNPLQHKTVRHHSPPSLVSASRRSDPPIVETPVPSSERGEAREALLLKQLQAERAKAAQQLQAERDKVAELERQARVAAETKVASFPPPVSPPPPPPVREPAKKAEVELEIAAVEGTLVWLVRRAVANRKAIYAIVAVIGIGGGGTAMKVSTNKEPSQAAVVEAIEANKAEIKRVNSKVNDGQLREANLVECIKCMRGTDVKYFPALLPSKESMQVGNVSRPPQWADSCKNLCPKD